MKRAALAAVLLVAAAAAAFALRPRASSDPVLVYRDVAEAPKKNDDHAMSLALASLSSVERDQVIASMEYATTRLEATLMPGAEDLGEGDPMDELKKALAHYAPVLTAARAFEQGSEGAWTAKDFAVRALAKCPEKLAPGERCVPVWGESDAARARFVAWPIAAARVLELPTVDARATCAENLRHRRARDDSTVALVLSSDDLALRPVPERDAVRKAARRLGAAMAVAKREDNQRLEAFGRAAPAGRVAPWLEVKPWALLVVPKLSALATEDAFHAELASVCRGARSTSR